METLRGYVLFAVQTDAEDVFFDSSEGGLDVLQKRRFAIEFANGYFAI